jgi:lipid A 3-O-deacylase
MSNPQLSKLSVSLKLILPVFLCLPLIGLSQAEKKYATSLNLGLDNDYLSIKMRGNDRYYSNGILMGFTSQVKKIQLLDRIAIATSSNAFRIRSFSIEHQIYTPHHIGNPNIQVGDYPYAALLVVNYGNRFLEQSYSFTSTLTLGMQGPAAMGYEIQKFLHKKVFHSNIPLGWKYQLPNDIAICYTLAFDKLIFTASNVEFIGNTVLQIGTLHNTFRLGGVFRFGNAYSYFDPNTWLFTKDKSEVKRQIYLTAEPYIKFVQGNSLLEGGPTKCPGPAWGNPRSRYYHINRDQMERLVYGYCWSLNYVSKWFSLSFQENMQSAEIKGLSAHEYAGVKVGLKL